MVDFLAKRLEMLCGEDYQSWTVKDNLQNPSEDDWIVISVTFMCEEKFHELLMHIFTTFRICLEKEWHYLIHVWTEK